MIEWTDYERRRLVAEAEARDAEGFEHVSAPVRRVMERVEATGAVSAAAEAGEPRRAPASAPIHTYQGAALYRRRPDTRLAYRVGLGLLIAFLIGTLSGAIMAQANAVRLDWTETQERVKG